MSMALSTVHLESELTSNSVEAPVCCHVLTSCPYEPTEELAGNDVANSTDELESPFCH